MWVMGIMTEPEVVRKYVLGFVLPFCLAFYAGENAFGQSRVVFGQSRAETMFDGQLNTANQKAVQNVGLEYSIELLRDGKIYIVDNRYEFRTGDKNPLSCKAKH